MIKLEFCQRTENERKKIVDRFYDINMKKRQSKKIAKLDRWCEKHLQNVLQTDGRRISYDFEGVVKALPEELMAMKRHLDAMPDLDLIMDELKEPSSKGKKMICYVRATLYKDMEKGARRLLIDSLDVSVCPYCNRNYVFSKDNADTCDLDHFIPEGKYPVFAASFYNLIPSCPVCNRKKNEKDFRFYPHDLESDIDHEIVFSYIPTDVDYMTNAKSIVVDVRSVPPNLHKVQIETLELDKIYRHHSDVAHDIVKKSLIFNEVYVQNLYHEFEGIFSSEAEVTELIYGAPPKSNEYGMWPLSKMTADLLKM